MIDLEALQKWASEGHRQVDIVIGGPPPLTTKSYSIHVYDFDLNIGQNIRDIGEIDLLAKKQKQIEALKKKVEKLEMEVQQYGDTSQESSTEENCS